MENEEKISVLQVCLYQRVSLDFVERRAKKDEYDLVRISTHLPLETYAKHLERKDDGSSHVTIMAILCRSPYITYEILNKYKDIFRRKYHEYDENITIVKRCRENLCENPNVPLQFLQENLGLIDWSYFSRNPNIPIGIAKHNSEYVDWYRLSSNSEFWRRLI